MVARGEVAAHRVDRDAHRSRGSDTAASGLSSSLTGADLAAAVVAAVRADPVRRLRLVALRALAEGDRGRSASCVRRLAVARLRVSSFRIRHDGYLHVLDSSSSPQQSLERAPAAGPPTRRSHSHGPVLRFVPHCGHRPWQSSRHSGFIGSAR